MSIVKIAWKLGTGIGAGIGAGIGGFAGYASGKKKKDKTKNAIKGAFLGGALGGAGGGFFQKQYRAGRERNRQYWENFRNRHQDHWGNGGGTGFTPKPTADAFHKQFGGKDIKTKVDFKKFYKQEARKHHPDLNPNDVGATKRFQEFQRHYEDAVKSDWFEKLASVLSRYKRFF